MKILYLLFVFLIGCSTISPQDGFVGSLKFEGSIIDLERENIDSKEELFNRHSHSGHLIFTYEKEGKYSNKFIAYINPLCNNKPVLNTNRYKLGMPILVSVIFAHNNNPMISDQPVVLIKGHPEWADSSYEHNGIRYTILPVCCGNEENAVLRFTYTIEKVERN